MQDGDLRIIRAHTHVFVKMAIIEDNKLSLAGRGLLIYLLAVTERDGNISMDKLLEQTSEDELDDLIEELMHHRYITTDENEQMFIHSTPQP